MEGPGPALCLPPRGAGLGPQLTPLPQQEDPAPKGNPPGLPQIRLLGQWAEENPGAEAQDPQEGSAGSQQPRSDCCPPAAAPSQSCRSARQRAALSSARRASSTSQGLAVAAPRVVVKGCSREWTRLPVGRW